jgi:hypothetical protein
MITATYLIFLTTMPPRWVCSPSGAGDFPVCVNILSGKKYQDGQEVKVHAGIAALEK